MGIYEIVFKRDNGSIGIDRFYANSNSSALKQFEEVYRYRSGKVVSCTKVS